jgi:replicative DNA helicase
MEKKATFLDKIIKDLKTTDIVNIIGKVGTGKSSLAMNIIKNVVMNSNKNVAMFSLGTTSVSLIPLLIKMKTNKLNIFMNKTDFEKDKEIDEETSKGFFYLYDGVSVTMEKIKQQVDSLIEELKKRKQKLNLVFIDYLQLTYPLNLSVDTNFNKIAEENIKKVKELAEHYNIPIILVTMLSNNDEKRNEQRKIIKDNSDIVMEIKREEDNSQIEITNSKNKTEIINCKFNKNSCEFIEVK